jgi:predicted DNA-binding mobile mystery protein A
MKAKKKLIIEQIDNKIQPIKSLEKNFVIPSKGWMHALRTTLNMSLRQFGKKLNISAQSAKEIEEREANSSITLKTLKEAAAALDMKFLYAIVPKEASVDAMIEKRAYEIAKEIVMRTAVTMEIEDQGNSSARLQKAIKEKAEEIKNEMPRYLWD